MSATRKPIDGASRLEQLLAASAARFPDRPAVRDGATTLTYAALNDAADRVASALCQLGVQIGDRVAMHLEKSARAVISLYGIMRAGAAYVPIDVAAPPSRCAYIAADCEVRAMIAEPARIEALREQNPAAAPVGIACGAEPPAGFREWDDVLSEPAAPPARQLIDTDLAYILYTSGSTGVPKGVAISHRTSLTFIRWASETFALSSEDVHSSHAPLHFDLSTLDLYGAASAGASVCLVPRLAALFPIKLIEWIREHGITVWYSVPSALSMLVRFGELGSNPLDSLRLVLFAGETFPTRYLRELMLQVPKARYYNLYGPTETNVCTYHEVTEPPEPEDPTVPIGRACENTRCQVVDGTGTTVTAVGGEGELIVEGSTVALGYWGDDEKTARGFPRPGVYRTGDIVQILEDSPPCYRFVGRNDHLIKSRGYRIELDEVESAVYSHPEVQECVVVPVPDELLGNRLAAFCVVRSETSAEAIRRASGERVPAYMVPEHVWLVDALPRTPNDKYDRPRLTQRAVELLEAKP